MKFILITLFILSTQALASNLQNKSWIMKFSECANGMNPNAQSSDEIINEVVLNFDEKGNLFYRAVNRINGKPCLLNGKRKYLISSDYNAGIDYITLTNNSISGCGINAIQLTETTWEYEMVSANQLIIKKLYSKLCSGSILINTYTN